MAERSRSYSRTQHVCAFVRHDWSRAGRIDCANAGHRLADGYIAAGPEACPGVLRQRRGRPTPRIADQPQPAWRLADLIAAQQAAGIVQGDPNIRPWYDDLLLACLEHRFASDVQLGRRMPDFGDDEISIGQGGRARRCASALSASNSA
jgi:hypothetical protein